MIQYLGRLSNIGNADFILVRELTELRPFEEELKKLFNEKKAMESRLND